MTEEEKHRLSYYSADIHGNIYSLRNKKLLKPAIASHGYPTVSLWHKNTGKTYCVHFLVWHYNNGLIPTGMVVNHLDGNKLNNNLNNLELCTQQQNIHHARDVLNHDYGKSTRYLTAEIVEKIREDYIPRKFGRDALAKKYNTSPANIQKIINNITWCNVRNLD